MRKHRRIITRRQFLQQTALLAATANLSSVFAQPQPAPKRAPVILGTDIGDDIDDTWALGFLLRCPELDVKLVYGEYGKSQYRGKLIAKFLSTVGRADIPVALGLDADPRGDGSLAEWVRDYDLKSYPSKIHNDAPAAIIEAIRQSSEQVTVISIGPAPNLAAALQRDPQLAKRARMVGMYGSLRLGYDGHPPISAEWNVKADAKACQTIFTASWDKTITPLDTCGVMTLDGERYAKIRDSQDVIAKTVIENYRIWARANNPKDTAPDSHSSTLFDTVAVYLAFAQDACNMENLAVRVTDDGFTRLDPPGNVVHAATSWKDIDVFRDLLVARLTAA
jgi:inosine-uridine nucleoside N-ribohydrolase